MFEELNELTLACIQFVFTVSSHIIFPVFTIGIAGWLAVLERRWLKTANTIYAEVDRNGLNTLKRQPAKVSAMEGLWATQRGAPMILLGWPDQKEEAIAARWLVASA
jgi:cytochrome bd-type quinol oxidase subunit 1